MKFIIRKLFLLFFLILFANHSYSINEDKAREFVVSIGNQAIKILKIPFDDKTKRKQELRNLLQEKFNMKVISKAILGREISKNTPSKKLDKFADIFEIHIVNVYSSQLGTYKGQVFTVKDSKIKNNKDAYVYSTIESPEYPTTNIAWRVRNFKEGLKVIDMQVENVSLLKTKKNDFAGILSSEGIDGLINKLNKMNNMPDLKVPGE